MVSLRSNDQSESAFSYASQSEIYILGSSDNAIFLSAKHFYTALFPHARARARTHARHPCGHLGLNVNNSRVYSPIFFKIYTLILIAILRYHIKNHCICFSRFVFIQFLIRSLFEKKNTHNRFLSLPLTV